jgi:hypothetical protein
MSAPATINRANAQHSTGPRTAEGKTRSSLNALRHGLTGQIVVMPSEDLEAYQRHVKAFHDEYEPANATESQLVQSLADAAWRLNRIAALESNILALSAADDDPRADTMAIAACFERQSKALANLSLHSQRLSRQFERTVTQLRELQKQRLHQENIDLRELLTIMDVNQSKGLPYNPSDDGFVFTAAQIQAARQKQHRTRKAWGHANGECTATANGSHAQPSVSAEG